MTPKKGLGRGLNAIIPPVLDHQENTHQTEIDIYKVEPNPTQPRKHFDQNALEDLAESIAQYGVLQPILVTKNGDFFSIIAGERRWRAAKLAKLTTIPVIVKDFSEQEILQVSLIENLQRSDLNLLEEAKGFERLSEEFGLTQEEISEKVNKNRSYISNAVRILELDPRVQNFVADKKISMGHLKLLMPLKSNDAQFELAETILDEGLSVRDAEVLVKEYITETKRQALSDSFKQHDSSPTTKRNSQFAVIEKELNSLLGAQVRIVAGKKRGKIEIEYYSNNDLDRLIGLFKTKMID